MTDASDPKNQIFDPDQPVLIIAEAGSNHNCSLDQAKEMIDAAAAAGCDMVKFQLFEADKLVPLGSYAHSVLNPLEFPRQWLPELVAHCASAGVPFCASPFDLDAVDQLAEHGGAPLLKIASPEIHDMPLIEKCAGVGCPLIISTGMATLDDIRIALETVRNNGNSPVVVLHCVSLYPAGPEHMNLRMMTDIAETFDVAVGLSDHSESATLPAVAVALGARVIEKHYTLDHNLTGPDHAFAMEPNQLTEMVKNIREAELSLGARKKEPIYGAEEIPNNNKAMLSRASIAANSTITEDLLCVKRAKGGIRPIVMDRIIGRTAAAEIAADTVITEDMLGD